MTIDYQQESSKADHVIEFFREENEDRITRGLLFEDETCRLLFGNSTNLLDDVLNHPLSIDYFNVYLSLPIFGQRVLYQRRTHQFDFDPPLLSKHQDSEHAKEWLIHCRLNNYIHTDIYIESLLALLLIKPADKPDSSLSKSYTFLSSKDTTVEEPSYIFSTVTDVQQFHQFLQSTSGIKYWNFFVDSMRLLRSRRSTYSNRIDVSYLNFIDKYYARKDEFHSISIGLDHPSMPNSSTSDTVWFQMAINAMYQLRTYWLPRYLSEVSLPSQVKIQYRTIDRFENVAKTTSSEKVIETSVNELPKTIPSNNEIYLVKHTLGHMSYIDYNPQQYILTQPSKQEDFQEDTDESDDTNPTEKDSKIEFEDILPSLSGRSIEDYASDANLELFYRVLVSDSLAGSPFSDYLSQTLPKTEIIPYQNCLRFLIDAEISFSIPFGKSKERILRQFSLRYLQVTTAEQLPNAIVDTIEERRTDLIGELITRDDNQYPLLWKLLLEITKVLIPYLLNFIKFDRLRFLVQIKGKTMHPNLILEDLHRHLPSINFKTSGTDQPETNSKPIYPNEREFIFKSTFVSCGEQPTDLLNPSMNAQYNTTEKLINTDEQCQYRLGERFPPLTDLELEEEVRRFRQKFQWNDIKIILGKSFNVSTTSHHPDHQVIDEDLQFNSIETFTTDVMNSAREILEIDHYVTNLMDESLNIFQTNTSFDSTKIDLNSSPLSPLFQEILSTDSSPSTTKTSPKGINNNAWELEMETKLLSSIGSYFINSPSETKKNEHLPSAAEKWRTNSTDFFHESIRFAPKDASNEVKDLLITKPIVHPQYDNQQELLDFIQNQIPNSQWPFEEYIGQKGQRAWRALKLAADISDLDISFMLNYHHDFDWISSSDSLGSFHERTTLILRDFHRRIEHQNCLQIN